LYIDPDDLVEGESPLTDLDPHVEAASKIFNIPPNEVTNTQREIGKTVNFGRMYGQTYFHENIPSKEGGE